MSIIERLKSLLRRDAGSRADWFVARLHSGRWSESDELELRQWCDRSEANAAAFERALAVWVGAESLAESTALLDGHGENVHGQGGWRTLEAVRPLAAAATVLLVLLAAWLAFSPTSREADSTLMRLTTGIGERKSAELPDGTRVELNTDSGLIVDYSNGRRRAILDQGEVFFDVAPAPGVPFTVEMGSRSITVLGTQFNVRRIPGQALSIAVVEGSIAVHRKEDRITALSEIPELKPDRDVASPDQYRVEAGTSVTLQPTGLLVATLDDVRTEDVSSWRRGILRFDGAPLFEVVRELNRYTEHTIVLEDPRIIDLEVNAVVHVDRLSGVFEGLERTLPIQVTQLSERVIIRARD
jgi:transmembrane sensor